MTTATRTHQAAFAEPATSFARTVTIGAISGVVASLAMAMYAMIAGATYLDSGFFTPLYHIASVVSSGDPMMKSMQSAMAGNTFTFDAGPAVLGAAVHMMTGAMYGIVFALIARALRLRGIALLAIGALYGVAVFAASTWIGLPLAAAVHGGDSIRNMATIVGYPTFIFEHVLFGAALGALLIRASTRSSR